MARGFSLEMCPWVYRARHREDGDWSEEYVEQPHRSAREEECMEATEREGLLLRRNNFPDLPLINYTTQYGMGVFEGLKAFPWADGTLRLFRPEENGRRFEASMKGLYMPPFPRQRFLEAVCTVAGRNHAIGFAPAWDPAWARDDFASGHSLYLRPFTYSEPGIGVQVSLRPWVIVAATPVGTYFKTTNSRAVTTRRVRATPGGTGWIKTDANYVASALAKCEAERAGYVEAIFLDAKEHRYFEEGSSCNIFFVTKGGVVVTPSLEDTILPGITRRSVLELAREAGLATEERRISVDEVFSEGRECFLTGTAAGITWLESLTHEGRTAAFGGKIGEVARGMLKTLKGIQYGAVADARGWMVKASG